VLVRAGVEGLPRTALWLLLSAALLAVALPVIRRADEPLALMATAGVALLVSPTSWSHHWVWIAPALLVMAATAVRERSPAWAVALVLTTAVFVVAPHQWLPRSGDVELGWTVQDQIVGSTYVWFTVLLFVAARCSIARRPQLAEVSGAP
jgi:alpha-1,2-mannosyltransferase